MTEENGGGSATGKIKVKSGSRRDMTSENVQNNGFGSTTMRIIKYHTEKKLIKNNYPKI